MRLLERFKAPAKPALFPIEPAIESVTQDDVVLTGEFEQRYLAAEQAGTLSSTNDTLYSDLLEAAHGDTVRASRFLMDLMIEYSDQL